MTINHVPYLLAFLFLTLLYPLLTISGAFRKKMAGPLLNLCFGKPALQGILPIRARVELTDTRGFQLFVETSFVQIRERPHTPELIKGLFLRSIKRSAHWGCENLLVFNDERFEPLEDLPQIDSFEVLGGHRGFLISYRFIVLSQELKTALLPKETEMTVPLLKDDQSPPDPLSFTHRISDQSWRDNQDDHLTLAIPHEPSQNCRMPLQEEDSERFYTGIQGLDEGSQECAPLQLEGIKKDPLSFVRKHDRDSWLEKDPIADNETRAFPVKTWDHADFEATRNTPVVSMMNENGLVNKVMVTCPTVFKGNTAVQVAKNLRLADPNEVVQIMTDGLSELSISYKQPADDPSLAITHRRRDALLKAPAGYHWEFFRGNAEKPMEWCLLKDTASCKEPAVNLLFLENEEAVEKGKDLGLICPEMIQNMFLVNGSPTEILYCSMGPAKDAETMAFLEDNVGGKWTYKFEEVQRESENNSFTLDLILFRKVQ